ncbi:MAG: GerW family sporulation protein [Pygmaiobacter massiliensis]|nr:GerW family sporulation protein [Pygmaiobacter massiliensis]
MNDNPLQGLTDVALQRIHELVDSNTTIGSPITTAEGVTILPISKVSFGFASGGSDFPSKAPKELFGGGSGAGVSITPQAFLVIKEGNVRLLQLADPAKTTADRLIDALPELVDRLQELLKREEKKPAAEP